MRLNWDDPSLRTYEAGVNRGVFYPISGPGVAWNGLTSVKESVDNTDQLIVYVDGQKFINNVSLGDFSATIEAYTYPDEFLPYDGYSELASGQPRQLFNMSYCSGVGDTGYKLHLVYNCLAKPSSRDYESLTADTDISTFSWDLTTTPVAFPYDRPTAHVFIDSRELPSETLEAIENVLYGSDTGDPRFPTVYELLSIFDANAIFVVIDNGDGTATVTGLAGWVDQDSIDPTQWTLTSPSVNQTAEDTYVAKSY